MRSISYTKPEPIMKIDQLLIDQMHGSCSCKEVYPAAPTGNMEFFCAIYCVVAVVVKDVRQAYIALH